MSRIYVLHENDAWVEPLRAAFDELGLPYTEWFLDAGVLDLRKPPPEGVFYNRMSASSHTRGHRYGPEYAAAVLAWLERHHRRVLNSGRALQLEVSKVAQYAALEACGIRTPATVAAIGRERIVEAARAVEPPFITKHNRAGKGLGVRLFRDREALARYVDSDDFEPAVDGITLIQRYVEAPEPYITRVEFIGGRYFYAVRVDTSQGFELCPADACRVDDAFCPADSAPASPKPLFRIVDGVPDDLVSRYQRFLADNGIHVAGIEFILDREGVAYTYDVNTNTNYNSQAEAEAGRFGMRALAEHLGRELQALDAAAGVASAQRPFGAGATVKTVRAEAFHTQGEHPNMSTTSARSSDNNRRIERMNAWIGEAEATLAAGKDQPHLQFLFCWLAYEAAYQDWDSALEHRKEREQLHVRLARRDSGKLPSVLRKQRQDAVKLLGLRQADRWFWERSAEDRGVKSAKEWNDSFEDRVKEKVETLAKAGRTHITTDVSAALNVLFENLSVVRHQIVHGASAGRRSRGLSQVIWGARLLTALVPCFRDIIHSNIDGDWGKPPYPRVGSKADEKCPPPWLDT